MATSGPVPMSLDFRFWSYVEKGNKDECWEWWGTRDRMGYGIIWERIGVRKKLLRRAHRVSWRIFKGYDSDRHVLHTCDNPPCVNPNHLFEGYSRDNTNDMIRKGRGSNQYTHG